MAIRAQVILGSETGIGEAASACSGCRAARAAIILAIG